MKFYPYEKGGGGGKGFCRAKREAHKILKGDTKGFHS